jgi:hypothetical protein
MLSYVRLSHVVIVKPQVKKCLSIKGAEDAINKPHAFEISTTDNNMFFIADSDKVRHTTLNLNHRSSASALS